MILFQTIKLADITSISIDESDIVRNMIVKNLFLFSSNYYAALYYNDDGID
jgi:hypothetical protein